VYFDLLLPYLGPLSRNFKGLFKSNSIKFEDKRGPVF
jgi:hypothetical protein